VVKRYFSGTEDQPPFLQALVEVRKIGAHEGWCYHHVQAIILAIDQYAEAATGNREFFWKRPQSLAVARPAATIVLSPSALRRRALLNELPRENHHDVNLAP
jgi:hypothetical protein